MRILRVAAAAFPDDSNLERFVCGEALLPMRFAHGIDIEVGSWGGYRCDVGDAQRPRQTRQRYLHIATGGC